jgi:hypothetical protein
MKGGVGGTWCSRNMENGERINGNFKGLPSPCIYTCVISPKLILLPWDGSSKFLRKVGNDLLDYMLTHSQNSVIFIGSQKHHNSREYCQVSRKGEIRREKRARHEINIVHKILVLLLNVWALWQEDRPTVLCMKYFSWMTHGCIYRRNHTEQLPWAEFDSYRHEVTFLLLYG